MLLHYEEDLLMFKSRLGIALAAAGIIFAVSPTARKAVRKLAVKSAGALLEITDPKDQRE
jgi:hypothetical protein